MQMILYPYSRILMKTLEMRKIVDKLRGVPTKLPISHLLCVLVYQTWYMYQKQCLDIVLLPYAALTLLRINGESRQKYIRVSIAKSPGEFYANFRPAMYKVYV